MKVTFVVPWYGKDIPGGAESEARHTAEHLAQAGVTVEVLTTTIKDFFADWGKNHYRQSLEEINGVTVRRFPVQKRDKTAFDAVNWRLMNNLPITAEQERTYIEEMFRVPALYEYMRTHQEDTIFIFIPYMFASTYFGAQVYPARSVVIPCLHDESYARLGLYKEVFPHVRAMVFHTDAELNLANRLYPQPTKQTRVVLGEGVHTHWTGDGARFRQAYGLAQPFVLYVGRRDAGKNTPLLLDYWRQYKQQHDNDWQLVLMGPGDLTIPADLQASVHDLGFVPLQDKYDAYAAATVFCLPSVNESFSLVLTEAWLAETPAMVHAQCAVTVEQCRKSNAGLYFANSTEFAGILHYLEQHPTIAQRMGELGRQYVLANYHWDIIVAKYKQLIAQITPTS